ncbi:MAG TPA: hypothetical protein VH575_06155 [Gemmataceae bacterium]|jgi:hypothetical protein
MTESEWNSCTDLQKMLAFLHGTGRLTERKARLFAVAVCQTIGHFLGDERSRLAVAVAEQYAEGVVPASRLEDAQRAAWDAHWEQDEENDRPAAVAFASEAAAWSVWWEPWEAWWRPEDVARNAGQTAWAVTEALAGQAVTAASPELAWREIQALEAVTRHEQKRAHCALLRDIFGNPFPPAEVIAPAVLAWNEGLVVKLGRAVYEERKLPCGTLDTAHLAVLADALEESGCANEEILGHLRRPGPHVRGCWPIDLLLGKR